MSFYSKRRGVSPFFSERFFFRYVAGAFREVYYVFIQKGCISFYCLKDCAIFFDRLNAFLDLMTEYALCKEVV